jgi:hypothetical protein
MIALLAALTIFFSPGAPAAKYPTPTMFLHGFHVVNGTKVPDANPVFGVDDVGPYVNLRFVSPMDGVCMLVQLVQQNGTPMALFLSHGSIPMGQVVQSTFHLAPPNRLEELTGEKGITETDYTIEVGCQVEDDPSSLVYSTLYHAPFATEITSK